MTARRTRLFAGAVTVLAVVVLAACGRGGTGGPTAPPVDTPTGYDVAHSEPEDYAAAVVEETNAARAAEGLDALATSDCAEEQALARAEALRGKPLEHAPLTSVQDACDPPSGLTAENLSRAAAEPADVVQAWLESPGHRNNVLGPELTQVGVSCVPDVDDGQDVMLCSQVFLG